MDSIFVCEWNFVQIPLTFDLKLHIASQAALGMTFLHESNLIHRDFKTQNILIDNRNNVRISDFGITRFKVCIHHVNQIDIKWVS